ncbi:transposase [Streptomyces sp. NPDC015139]|uniref:transposase n=1 Tax=Streptomyces sp. NPDC015139 TaxID=3364942 RepID=UPI0037035E43
MCRATRQGPPPRRPWRCCRVARRTRSQPAGRVWGCCEPPDGISSGICSSSTTSTASQNSSLGRVGACRSTIRYVSRSGAPPPGHVHAPAFGPVLDTGHRPTVDWENKTVTCPNGATARNWRDALSHRGTPIVRITFRKSDCQPCPVRSECISSATATQRQVTVRPRPAHEAIQQARAGPVPGTPGGACGKRRP